MTARTIVVGAGVLGLSVAERLAAKGAAVTLVDRGQPGGGTSRTSMAWLNSNGKLPLSYHQLNVEGVKRYRELVGTPGTAAWLHLDGRIEWGVGADEVQSIEARVAALRDLDYPVEAITPGATRRLEPDLRVPDAAAVTFWPSEGFVVPPVYLEWLLARGRSRGVEVLADRAVSGFAVEGGAVRAVRFADGSGLPADLVVSCVGRWTETLLRSVGVHIPMLPPIEGGAVLAPLGYSTPVATRLTRMVSTASLSVRPDGPAGRYLLHGHRLDQIVVPGSRPEPDGELGGEILALGRAMLVGFDRAGLAELRLGYRAVPADRVAVAGWAPGIEGLYVVATHSGYTLALHLGELVAREVAEAHEEPTLADFRPDRFATEPLATTPVEVRPVH